MTGVARLRSHYSNVAIALHWLIALLVIGNLAGGLLLDTFFESPDAGMKAIGNTVISLHKSTGLLILALTVVRLGWRVANPAPPLPAAMTVAEKRLALATHGAFYLLLFAIPLTGWAVASTGKAIFPIEWYGLFTVPHLPIANSYAGAARESHQLLAYGAIALIALHIGAALKHQYFDRDDLIARMLFRPR